MDFYKEYFEVPWNEIRIFILIDGFGMNLLQRLEESSWFSRHYKGEMRSVFPSTTAVALSCLASGREPGELGVTGWTSYLPERNSLVNVLTSRDALGEYAEGAWDPEIVPASLLVPSRLARPNVHLINPSSYLPQGYAAWTTGGVANAYGYEAAEKEWTRRQSDEHWLRVLLHVLNAARPGDLLYVYLPQVDASSHRHGWDHENTLAVLAEIENDIRSLEPELEAFAGAADCHLRLRVSADHGLLNIPQERYFYIDDTTPWMSCLVSPISGEGRNPVFHVIPGLEQEFRRLFEASPEGRCFELLTPEELVSRSLFPQAGISAAARPRWGSFVGLAHEAAYLEDLSRGQKRKNFKAAHGGTHPHEREVPLFALDL